MAYLYLSKKIQIPGGIHPLCVDWNLDDGSIACGGDEGLLKVLKLDSSTPSGQGGNLPVNQTLQGHQVCESISFYPFQLIIDLNSPNTRLLAAEIPGIRREI